MTSTTNDSNQLTIPQALELATAYQASGKLNDAEILLRKVLQAQPENAFALHLLGCIAHQVQQPSMAIQLITQAIALQPDNALFHRNIAEMYRQQGNTEKAISHSKHSLSLEPGNAVALSNLGIAYYDLKTYPQAIDYQQQALAINPQLVTALNNLGSIYREQKDTDKAIEYYQRVIAINPEHAESLNNLGAVYTESSDPEQGLPLLEKAITINPAYAEAQRNLGSCYLVLENIPKAQTAFQMALHLKPQFPEALLGLASIEQEARQYDRAEQLIQQAITINSGMANGHIQLAGLLNLMGFIERSHNSYEHALSLEPDNIAAYVGKSHLLTEQGLIDEAEQCLLQALTFDPKAISARVSLAQLKKVKEDDSNFLLLKAEAEELSTASKTRATGIHFALGKCHDDIGQYEQGFSHFLQACRLKREKINYSQSENTLATLNIISTFTPELIAQLTGFGHSAATPIFILGMPRSGTTLTEQIIASHPQCYGAGELSDIGHIANNVDLSLGSAPITTTVATTPYPQSMGEISAQQLKQLGEHYVNGLQARQPDAPFITDKMPSNYFYLGLIHLMLPNAKIIHVNRNPVDTCISNFSKLFKHGQYFSYDLSELGYYYRDYFNLMNHWRTVLPDNAFYDLQYEALVDNTEVEARALIDYCGLEWDEQCLQFHTNSRSIKTASVTQVRQPIYRSSVQRWRHYEKYIGPLLNALGDLVPQDLPD